MAIKGTLNRPVALLVLLLALFALPRAAVAGRASGAEGNADERAMAVDVATRFLDQLDGGQYGSTWELTGAHMRRLTSRPMWAATLSGMRGGSGPLKSRELEGATFATTLPASPPGHYFVLRFDSRFEKLAVEEKVVLNLEQGRWRIEGYAMGRSPTRDGK